MKKILLILSLLCFCFNSQAAYNTPINASSGGGSPGGVNTDLQYNSSGSFGGATYVKYDSSNYSSSSGAGGGLSFNNADSSSDAVKLRIPQGTSGNFTVYLPVQENTATSASLPIAACQQGIVQGHTTADSSLATCNTSLLEFTYRVDAYVNIISVLTDVLELQLTYVDNNGNTQTINLLPIGASTALMSSTGIYTFPTFTVPGNAGGSTGLTAATILTTGGGTINYDAFVTITPVY